MDCTVTGCGLFNLRPLSKPKGVPITVPLEHVSTITSTYVAPVPL